MFLQLTSGEVRGPSGKCRSNVGGELSRSLLSFTVVNYYQLLNPFAYCPAFLPIVFLVTYFPVLLSAALYCTFTVASCPVLHPVTFSYQQTPRPINAAPPTHSSLQYLSCFYMFNSYFPLLGFIQIPPAPCTES